MHLIFYFFFICFLNAREIKVDSPHFQYQIEYDKNHILYSTKYTKLSLKKNNCNDFIFKRVRSSIENFAQKEFLRKETRDSYSIQIDQEKKYDLLKSDSGAFFSQFDNYFKTLKIEEKLNCN